MKTIIRLSLSLLVVGIECLPTFSVGAPIVINASVATDSNTPEAALYRAMQVFCPKLTDSDPQNLRDVCALLSADLSLTGDAYKQLSARSVTAMTTLLSRGPATVSLEDIGSRLAALRRASRNLNTALLEPGLIDSNDQFAMVGLSPEFSGGGASADEKGGLYDNRLSGFISGAYVKSQQTESSTLAGFDAKNYGVTLGLDYRFSHDTYAGLATRLLNGNADLNNNGGSLDSNDVNVTFYSTYFPTPSFYIDATLQASRGKYDLSRKIDFTVSDPANNVNVSQHETAKGNTDGNQYGASLGAGYEIFLPEPAVTVELTGTFKYNRAKLSAYTEDAANGLNLSIDEQTITTEQLSLGTQFSHALSYNWGVLLPQLNLAWKHDFKTNGQDIGARFVADPSGTKFVFTSDKRDPDYLEVALGVSGVTPGGWTTFAQMTSYVGYKQYRQTMASLGVRKEF